MHGEDKNGTAKWHPENLDGTNILADLDNDRRIILKWNLYIQNVRMWTTPSVELL
jgi:hypothetical protein